MLDKTAPLSWTDNFDITTEEQNRAMIDVIDKHDSFHRDPIHSTFWHEITVSKIKRCLFKRPQETTKSLFETDVLRIYKIIKRISCQRRWILHRRKGTVAPSRQRDCHPRPSPWLGECLMPRERGTNRALLCLRKRSNGACLPTSRMTRGIHW